MRESNTEEMAFFLYGNCCFLLCCVCIMTRGGIYGELYPEPKGVPADRAKGNSLWLHTCVYIGGASTKRLCDCWR